MMGGYPPNQPPFNNNMGPPQQQLQHQHHMHQMNVNPHNMQMSQGPPPHPPGVPPNQQMHGQPPFPPVGGPPNMMRSPIQQHPYGQGFPPQQQQQQQQPQQMNQLMTPQQPQQYQQHPPPMNMAQYAPGMPPQQYPPYQPPPQSMQQPQAFVQSSGQSQNVHQLPQTSLTAAAAATQSKSADAAWTEHKSPSGVPYYYNVVTGVSTYDRPAAIPALAVATSLAPPSPAVANPPPTIKSKWQTFTDEGTGKKYYSDGVQTTWTRPAELPPEEGDVLPPPPTKRQKSDVEDDDRRPKKKKTDKGGDAISLYANKAEAVAAFKGLLLAKDVAPSTKWADVVRACSEDARWEACSTMGERKQALAEYQTKRANELKDVKRQEKVRAKEAYQRLLADVLPSSKTFAPGTSRFMDVRDSLSKDDRFYAVEDETTREELYYEFVEELRKKEERSKHNKKREAKEGCLKFLRGKEEEGKLTFASTW